MDRPRDLVILDRRRRILRFLLCGVLIMAAYGMLAVCMAESPIAQLRGHRAVRDLVFSPDGKLLVSGDGKGEIVVWDVNGEQLTTRWLAHGYDLHALAFSPDGKLLATSGDQRIVLWNPEKTKARVGSLNDARNVDGGINPNRECLAFSPNGTSVIAGTQPRLDPTRPAEIIVWNAATRAEVARFIATKKVQPQTEDGVARLDVIGATFHAVGFLTETTFVSGDSNSALRFWDLTTKTETDMLETRFTSIDSIAAFEDLGLLCVSGDISRPKRITSHVEIWDYRKRQRVGQIERPAGCVKRVPGTKYALVGSSRGHVLVVDVTSQKVIKDFKAHDSVGALAVSASGLIATAGTDGGEKVIKLWQFKLE
jgi:WD40 repeat protein